jgi:hypothetical protein
MVCFDCETSPSRSRTKCMQQYASHLQCVLRGRFNRRSGARFIKVRLLQRPCRQICAQPFRLRCHAAHVRTQRRRRLLRCDSLVRRWRVLLRCSNDGRPCLVDWLMCRPSRTRNLQRAKVGSPHRFAQPHISLGSSHAHTRTLCAHRTGHALTDADAHTHRIQLRVGRGDAEPAGADVDLLPELGRIAHEVGRGNSRRKVQPVRICPTQDARSLQDAA